MFTFESRSGQYKPAATSDLDPDKCVYIYKPLDGPAVAYYYEKKTQKVEKNIEYTKSPNGDGNSYIYNGKRIKIIPYQSQNSTIPLTFYVVIGL